MTLEHLRRAFFGEVDRLLQANGFKRAPSRQWVRDSGDVTHLIDFQASNYSPGYYYINIGVNVKNVPVFGVKCYHLHTRLDFEGRGPQSQGIDLILPDPDEELRRWLELLQTKGMAFFSEIQTVDDVCERCSIEYAYLGTDRHIQEFCRARKAGVSR